MNMLPPSWLLLVVSLPTQSATARTRIWRALKTLGCHPLRDGAYLAPARDVLKERLREFAQETRREGGNAWLLGVTCDSEEQAQALPALFDGTEEYAAFLQTLEAERQTLSLATAVDINRLLRKLRRDYEVVQSMDYFPNAQSQRAEAAWADFVHVAQAMASPGEPTASEAGIVRLDTKAYRGRTWATRCRLWVDRVASAWLIQRFIDPQAHFLWLASPADCPAHALGFDFDGAAFTHVGERVNFEVLLHSFGLEQDRGLARLGTMVHGLDVGGVSVPEAAGFEAMLSGIRQRAQDDDQLLLEVSPILDALYQHFSNEAGA